MKLYRYMSVVEFVQMSLGTDMIAYHEHFNPDSTTSSGFCFLAEKTYGRTQNLDGSKRTTLSFTPLECQAFLTSVVDDEILVEFEVDNIFDVKHGYGYYNNPNDRDSTMIINEYSSLTYDKKTFKPLRYILGPSIDSFENSWEDFSEKCSYNIRDLMTQIIAKKRLIDFYHKPIRKLGFLPPIPNTSDDEMWRVINDYDHRDCVLLYGNPITNQIRYRIFYNVDTKEFDFGEDVPDFWQKLKNLYDDNSSNLNDENNLFFIAALIASYPQISSACGLVITPYSGDSYRIDLSHKITILSMFDLFLTLNDNGSLGIKYYEPKSLTEFPDPENDFEL